MSIRNYGFDIFERFESIEANIDKRFYSYAHTVNNLISSQADTKQSLNDFVEQTNHKISELVDYQNFLLWVINLSWYKRLWYSIRKIDLITKYKLLKHGK